MSYYLGASRVNEAVSLVRKNYGYFCSVYGPDAHFVISQGRIVAYASSRKELEDTFVPDHLKTGRVIVSMEEVRENARNKEITLNGFLGAHGPTERLNAFMQ